MDILGALNLTRRLQEELSHDIYFTQALLEYTTFEDVAVLESMLALSQNMRLEALSEERKSLHQNIKEIDRRTQRKTKRQVRKVFRVTKEVRV